MFVLKLVATSSSAAVVSVEVDIPENGLLEAFHLATHYAANATPASGDNAKAELSFLSAPTFSTHGARGSLGQVEAVNALALASSALNTSIPSMTLSGLSIPVSAGERLFLHIQNFQADITSDAWAYVYIKGRGGSRARRRA